jgi:hypothetical protein
MTRYGRAQPGTRATISPLTRSGQTRQPEGRTAAMPPKKQSINGRNRHDICDPTQALYPLHVLPE